MLIHTFLRSLLFGIILLASGGLSNAAVLTHVYRLDGSLADDLGGPNMTNNGGTLGAAGITFGMNQGPSLSSALNPTTYSVEMHFQLDSFSGWRKLLDFNNRVSDDGLYTYPILWHGPVFAPELSTYVGPYAPQPSVMVDVVLTRDSTGQTTAYFDGVLQWSFNDSASRAVFSGPNSIAYFLTDDTTGASNESSSGFIDYVRIWDGALTATEVANLTPPVPHDNQAAVPESASLLAWFTFALLGLVVRVKRGSENLFRRICAGCGQSIG